MKVSELPPGRLVEVKPSSKLADVAREMRLKDSDSVAVMDGGRLVGFFDWDIAFPSPREDDLAYSALLWVPLTAPEASDRPGSPDVGDRSRRLHLLLDTYRYDSDRRAFGAAIVERARRQASAIRSMADAGDRAAIALRPIASRLDRAASYVEALPGGFWTP